MQCTSPVCAITSELSQQRVVIDLQAPHELNVPGTARSLGGSNISLFLFCLAGHKIAHVRNVTLKHRRS